MNKGRLWRYSLIFLGLYVGSFAAFKAVKPSAVTSNDGPGHIYCAAYLPLRFLSASFSQPYWQSAFRQHWHTVKYLGFNPGNGYLDIEYLDGTQGRSWSGRDIEGAKAGEIWMIRFAHVLETWDDFSDHLVARVDRARQLTLPPEAAVDRRF